MLVQESVLSLKETLHSRVLKDAMDEADETLSLRDLPLHSSVDEWQEDLPLELERSSSIASSKDDGYFEFFSQEWNPNPNLSTTTTYSQPENIIFCGKLIPYKQPDSLGKDASRRLESNRVVSNTSVSSKKQIQNNKNSKDSTRSSLHQHEHKKHQREDDFPVQKMSVLTSSPSGKVRWYSLLFGISRNSRESDLKDSKSRHSRRLYPSSPSPASSPLVRFEYRNEKISGGRRRSDSKHSTRLYPSPSPSSSPSPLFKFPSSNEKIGEGRRSGSCGLWGLIGALSCNDSHYSDTMVAESISSTRRE